MIVETQDNRRLEVIHLDTGNRLFICIEDPYGSQETIILDTVQAEMLQSFLNTFFGASE